MSDSDDEGLFGRLKKGAVGLFYEESDDAVETAAAPDPVPPAVPLVPAGTKADPEIVARLEGALKASGASALGSVLSVFESMVDVIPDQNTRLKAAFKATQAQGVTDTAVLGDFDKLEKVLASEEKVFTEESERATEQEVGGRQQRIQACREMVKVRQEQVESLRAQIAALDTGAKHDLDEATRLESEIAVKQQEIRRVQATFQASLAHVRAGLAVQKAMIASLKKGK